MIDRAVYRVVSDSVLLFNEVPLPRGDYAGALEWLSIQWRGTETRLPVRAMISIDREFFEERGVPIVEHLKRVDFDLFRYLESGDLQLVN